MNHRTARSARRKASTTTAIGTCLVIALSACNNSSDDASDDSPSATPTPTASTSADPTQAAKTEVIARYQAYWKEMQRAYATASVDGTDLKKYAASTALLRTEHETEQMEETGRVYTGTVTVNHPTATVHLNRKLPNATLTSCLDVSMWKVVEKDTKKVLPLPSKRLTKYITLATLEKWPDGWKVIRDEPQAGKPC